MGMTLDIAGDRAPAAEGSPQRRERRSRGRAWTVRVRSRLPVFLLPVAMAVAYVVLGWSRRWTLDDAFINYRVVKQIEAGNGPVFNTGERVEVATSTAWLVILTIGDLLSPLSIEWTALVLQLAFGVAGLLLGMAGALRLADLRRGTGSTGWVVPVGAAAFFALKVSWDFATGGLENGMGMAWMGGSFWAVVVACCLDASSDDGTLSRRRLRATAVLVGLGVLVRPDFAPFCAGLALPLGVVAWHRDRVRGLLSVGVAAAALPLAVQVFRMGYYAQLVPNTLHAKSSSLSWWDQGWVYLGEFAGSYLLVVPVAAAVVWLGALWWGDAPPTGGDGASLQAWRTVVVGVELGAAAHVLGVVRVGGDYMHGRLLLPAWFALLLPVFAVRASELRSRRSSVPAIVIGVWAVAAAATLRPAFGTLFNEAATEHFSARQIEGLGIDDSGSRGIVDVRHTAADPHGSHPVEADDYLDGMFPHDVPPDLDGDWYDPRRYAPGWGGGLPVHPSVNATVVPAYMLGVAGYVTPLDIWVYDRLGLADPIVARAELDGRGTAGHEKMLSSPWVAAAFVSPRYEVRDPRTFAPIDPLVWTWTATGVPREVDAASFAADRRAARRALDCGGLSELVHDTRAPLDAKRFLGNIVDAVRLHDVSIPVDPHEARDRFCGR